jgi:hypothetical protein
MCLKRWLTLALVALAVVTVAGNVAHARNRTRVPHDVISNLADRDGGLVLAGVLSPVATTSIEAPVWNLAAPLNFDVIRGQVIGETMASLLPDQAAQGDDWRLSPEEARLAVAQAQEDVRQAEADLEAARASAPDAEVQQVLTKYAERASEQRLENEQFREVDMPAASHGQPVLDADSAVATAEAARFQAQADDSAVSGAMTRLQEDRIRLAGVERQWQPALARAEGGREGRRVSLLSPADGLLVARDPIAGTLGICSDPNILRVETWISADDLLKLRVGQPAWVSLDAEPQVTLRATVSEIAEEPIDSPNDAIYPVALSVDNPQGLVLVGEKVRARTASPEAGTR